MPVVKIPPCSKPLYKALFSKTIDYTTFALKPLTERLMNSQALFRLGVFL